MDKLLNTLEEFLTLCDTKSYVEAARRLKISQSSLTRHMQSLESDLGLKIFDRTSRSVSINKYGNIFLSYANEIYQKLELLHKDLEKAKTDMENMCFIGMSAPHDRLLMGAYTNDPCVLMDVEYYNSSSIQELLDNGVIDVGFITDDEMNRDDYEKILFSEDTYVAILYKSHPLARKKKITLKDIADENFISYFTHTDAYNDIIRVCENAGFTPRIVCTADMTSSFLPFVINGDGIAIAPKIETADFSQIFSIVDFDPEININTYLYYPKKEEFRHGVKVFIDFARDQCIGLN